MKKNTFFNKIPLPLQVIILFKLYITKQQDEF